jgi:hypothetical protein
LGFGLTAIFATGGLNATTFYSAKVAIPFNFKVGNISLDAGEYRVYQEFGKDIAYVINLKTGHRVQMLRSAGGDTQGRARLRFENKDGVQILTAVS